MRVPFSFLTEQFSNSEPIFLKLKDFLKRCDFTLGEDVTTFENRYAEYCGSKFAIGVGSGTDALALSLKVAGVNPGDEVITAPNSFVATTGAIVQVGAKPVYVDVTEQWSLDPQKIERAITRKTKAILPVHWAGHPADITEIAFLAKKNQLPVIEDACQSLGARLNGKSVGSFGLLGAFSVHPIKPLHVWGDGGVIVTDDADLAKKLRLLRNHGLEGRDVVQTWGVNSRLDSVHAIVGNFIFETLDNTISYRRNLAQTYDQFFNRHLPDWVTVPLREEKKFPVYHLYQVKVKQRDSLLSYLKDNGVEAKVHYPIPLHLQPAAALWNYKKGDFPITELQSKETITLPCHQFITEAQQNYVLDTIQKFYANQRYSSK